MADYLPPRELWPTRVYKLPEFATYPERFNPTEELLDKGVARGWGERAALLFGGPPLTYAPPPPQASQFGYPAPAFGLCKRDRLLLPAPTHPPAARAPMYVLHLAA